MIARNVVTWVSKGTRDASNSYRRNNNIRPQDPQSKEYWEDFDPEVYSTDSLRHRRNMQSLEDTAGLTEAEKEKALRQRMEEAKKYQSCPALSLV